MAPWLTAVWLAVVAVVIGYTAEGAVYLTGCERGNITVLENTDQLKMKCLELTNPEAVYHWTVDTENGTEVPLGTCHSVNNCTALMSDVEVKRPRATFSTLTWSKVHKRLSGNITCTVSTNSGTDTNNCRLYVIRVRAREHMVDVSERSAHFLQPTCFISPLRPSSVTWTLTLISGATVPLGDCNDGNQCTSLTSDFTLSRSHFFDKKDSVATLQSEKRDLGGRLSCTFTYKGQNETAYIVLNVHSPPAVLNCSIGTRQHNWTAMLSCDVIHAFSTAGVYQYRLLQLTHSLFLKYYESPFPLHAINGFSGLKSSEQRSFLPNLHTYMNATDNQTYYGGRLEYSWRLSSSEKEFQYATVVFCTSSKSYDCIFPSPYFTAMPNISMPGTPSHNCSQLSHIPENGTIICTCSTDSVGSPPGRLLWLLDNVVWSTGQYGVRQLSLSTESMTRQQNMKQATCRLDWIDPQDVHLPLNVAYGPDKVKLHVYQRTDDDDRPVTVECQVTGLNPRTPDMVQWEGPCQGQQGFTCTLDLRQATLKGKIVACRVTNSANNGQSAEAVKMIWTDFIPPKPYSSSEEVKWAAIGGAVVLAVVVVITLLVILVIWVCRRSQPRTVPQPGYELQTKNSTRDSYSYHEFSNNTAGEEPSRAPESGHVYDNTGASEMRVHL